MLMNTPWDLRRPGQYYYNRALQTLFFIPPKFNGNPRPPAVGDVINVSLPAPAGTSIPNERPVIASSVFKAQNLAASVKFSDLQMDTGICNAIEANNAELLNVDKCLFKSYGDDIVTQRLSANGLTGLNGNKLSVTNSTFQDGWGRAVSRQNCRYQGYSDMSYRDQAESIAPVGGQHKSTVATCNFLGNGRLLRSEHTVDFGNGNSDIYINQNNFSDSPAVALWATGTRVEILNNVFSRCAKDTTDVGAVDQGRSLTSFGSSVHNNQFFAILPYNELPENEYFWGEVEPSNSLDASGMPISNWNGKAVIYQINATNNTRTGIQSWADAYSTLSKGNDGNLDGGKLFVAGVYWDDRIADQKAYSNFFRNCHYSYYMNAARDSVIYGNMHVYDTSVYNASMFLANSTPNLIAPGGPLRCELMSFLAPSNIINNLANTTVSPGLLDQSTVAGLMGQQSKTGTETAWLPGLVSGTGVNPYCSLNTFSTNWQNLDTRGRFPIGNGLFYNPATWNGNTWVSPYAPNAVLVPLGRITKGVNNGQDIGVNGWATPTTAPAQPWVTLLEASRAWRMNLMDTQWVSVDGSGNPLWDTFNGVPSDRRVLTFRIWYKGADGTTVGPNALLNKSNERVIISFKVNGTSYSMGVQPDARGYVYATVPRNSGQATNYLIKAPNALAKLKTVASTVDVAQLGTIELDYGDLDNNGSIGGTAWAGDNTALINGGYQTGRSQDVSVDNSLYKYLLDLNCDGRVDSADKVIFDKTPKSTDPIKVGDTLP